MTTSTESTDRIEKSITVKATPARVWRALSSAHEFGAWFGANLSGDFAPGATITGKLTIKGYEHLAIEIVIARMERDSLLAFHWHPNAIDTSVDFSGEPMTLVEMKLEAIADGTRVTVVESGFDKLPAARRAIAFASNSGGWVFALGKLEHYVA